MESIDYTKNVQQLMAETNRLNEKQTEWAQRILFLSATLFGILISLGATIVQSPSARLCFSIATALLALGCLTLAAVLYSHLEVQKRTRELYHQELLAAIRERRRMEIVYAKQRKFFVVCEPIAYTFLILAVLSLAVYSFLTLY